MEYLATGSQRKVKGCPNSLPSGRRAGPVPVDTPDNRSKDVPGPKTKVPQCRWSEVLSDLTCAQVVAGAKARAKDVRRGKNDVWLTFFPVKFIYRSQNLLNEGLQKAFISSLGLAHELTKLLSPEQIIQSSVEARWMLLAAEPTRASNTVRSPLLRAQGGRKW